jgi:hypothetical protein
VTLRKAQTTSRVHAIPQLRFEQQQLTSFSGRFSGLVLFQMLFGVLDLRRRLARCFRAVRAAAYQQPSWAYRIDNVVCTGQ